MKLSISLPDDDVEFLDRYAEQQGVDSRSAVVAKAIELLRTSQLVAAYTEAWSEWDAKPDNLAWDSTVADGIGT